MNPLLQIFTLVLLLTNTLNTAPPVSTATTHIQLSPTPQQTTATPVIKPTTISTASQTPSGNLPVGTGTLRIGYGLSTKNNPYYNSFSPPGVSSRITYLNTGYTIIKNDSPGFTMRQMPAGKYRVDLLNAPVNYTVTSEVSANGTNKRVEVPQSNAASASFTLSENGDVGVGFYFVVKSENTSSDNTPPNLTKIDGPGNLWSGGDHVISNKDFCLTFYVTDNISPEQDIESKVTIEDLDKNLLVVSSSDWSKNKTHCVTSLKNGSYQLHVSLRDAAGNTQNFGTDFRLLSS